MIQKEYYDHLLIDIDGNILTYVSGMIMKKDDSLRYIELSFESFAALEEFKKHLPFGYANNSDSYEFIEKKRNETTGK